MEGKLANRLLVFIALTVMTAQIPTQAQEVIDACFRPDVAMPGFDHFWSDTGPAEVSPRPARVLGGSLHVYLRNTSSEPLGIEDVTLEGISLTRAIAFSDQRKFKRCCFAASIHFSDLPHADRDKLIAAGEPVWWKVEPALVRPGETAAVTVRLRRVPPRAIAIELMSANAKPLSVSIAPAADAPRVEGISFSPGLDMAYLYFRHPVVGKAASKVFLDGIDVTDASTICRDANIDVLPVVLKLKSPLARGSLHCFQAVYDDGSKATAAVRAWADGFAYGLWGGRPGDRSRLDIGRAHAQDLALHNINLQLPFTTSQAFNAYSGTDEGLRFLRSIGFRFIVHEPGKAEDLFAFYLADEPDTADYKVTGVPGYAKIGCLGQGLLKHAGDLRRSHPDIPNMLNVDMTFKPDNWYIYGQLPDYFAADPYYQTRLAEAYWNKPATIPWYSKCTFVYGVATICRSACAPNPLHIMLNSVRSQQKDRVFRWGTREEKRIELFYALAAGAKQISYWWFTPSEPKSVGANGMGADHPQAKALWNEVGLLGAEVRTAGDLIARSCPASLPVNAPDKVWVRSLIAGADTAILLCVNDDYTNNEQGTTIKPVDDVSLGVTVPTWLKPKSVFEVSVDGPREVLSWQWEEGTLEIKLGTVQVTRMIVITADAGLRDRLQKLYDEKFAANVAKLKAGG
mgnify:CR=1 FL=1